MPRSPKPRFVSRSQRWYLAVGDPLPSGKSAMVILRYADGRPVAPGDEAGAGAAAAKLLGTRQTAQDRQGGITVAEMAGSYLRWLRDEGRTRKTLEGHDWHLGKFAAFVAGGMAYGDRPAASIEVEDLTAYRKAMERRGNQSGYIRIAYASILALWTWAARPVEGRRPSRLLERNPFAGLARPEKGEGRDLVLSPPLIAALVALAYARAAEAPHPDWPRNLKVAWNRAKRCRSLRALCLRLMAECGARPKEAVTLRWAWVTEAERWVVIPRAYTKTRRKDRVLILSPEVAGELANLRAVAPDPVYVFAGDPGVEPSPKMAASWFRDFRQAAQAVGIDVPDEATLYTFRHSFVTNAAAGGMDLRAMAPGLGHSAAVSESTYQHAQRRFLRELMDRAREAAKG